MKQKQINSPHAGWLLAASLAAGLSASGSTAIRGDERVRETANEASARSAGAGSKSANELLVYIGTYTRGNSKGIYAFRINGRTGEATPPELAAETVNPSFLAVHPNGRLLYAVGEIGEYKGRRAGAVAAFRIDRKTGSLTELNRQPSGGAGPCHLVVDPSGTNVLVANYGGGSVAVLPVDSDGRLKEPSSVIRHKGSSINPRRQQAPHAHSINLDPAGRFAFAADLGTDKVYVYRFDAKSGALTPHDPPAAALQPGAGPRHFAFHPGGRFAYVINELHCTVTAFRYNPEKGELTTLQTVATLPGELQKGYSTAEVQVHPSGRFVYGSNRGHDSIAVFAVDEKAGHLKPLGHEPTGGRTPRNFGIDPSGRWLLAANQNSGNVVVFRIDEKSGRLQRTPTIVEIPSPVCVKFLELTDD